MKNLRHKSLRSSVLQPRGRSYLNSTGNVLIYVVVLMLIFGVLGVVMVSLFTSSTASTVTRNDTRRAIYMAESGMRYAFSEIRKANFDLDFMNDTLNTITYKIGGTESFTINVFSPWFESPSNQTIGSGGGDLALDMPVGELPDGYSIPTSNIFAINWRYTKENPADESGSWAPVTGFNPDTTTLTLGDDFNASRPRLDEGEEICLAVRPKSIQSLADGSNLDVSLEAQTIFPKYGGAINIRRNDYFYEERIDDPDNNRVILSNLSKRPESNWITATTSDFVVLSPRNYMVAPTGKSGDTVYGGDYTFAKGIYYKSLIPTEGELTLTTMSEQETESRFFELNPAEDKLYIGGGSGGGGGLTNEFGTALFNATLSIGGDEDYCVEGACLFELGVRVYFLLDFRQQGDGITFTLINGANNRETSAGGDFELSELLGYAGDSRTASPPGPTDFLATAPEDRGLDPPKIAVEFDTRTNNRVGDPPPDYCADASTVNTNSRNDPLTSNEDAVQYVFWGRTNFLDIPCRNNSPLYDDNRHDADGEEPTEEWRLGTGAAFSFWHPAVGPDGTTYMSALNATLYALNEDGTIKWTFNLGDNNDYMPGVDPATGTIYSDIAGNSIIAINPDGTEKWRLYINADFDSTPVVGPDGTIFFGTDSTPFAIFAVNPNGTPRWQFNTGADVDNVPALSPDGSVVYAVSNDNNLYAVNVSSNPAIDGTLRWQFPILTEPNEVNSSPIVNPADGTIYVGSDDHKVYALNPTARTAGLPFPQAGEWAFTTGGEVEPSAAIDDGGTPGDKSDDTIYIGSDDHYFYAIRANGTQKWRYQTNGEIVSSAVVDLDGTVYVGSDDSRVYAFNPNGSLKWFFDTGGPVQSSPVLGQDGFIRVGSNDGNFYTISQFADPRNYKDLHLTIADLDSTVSADDTINWLSGSTLKGPWAVRLEVDRGVLGDYELRLWMKQCDNDTCDTLNGANDPFFKDTRINYRLSPPDLYQSFQLDAIKHAEFNRFLFGFTAAAGADPLDVIISNFVLSFVRPGDPVIN